VIGKREVSFLRVTAFSVIRKAKHTMETDVLFRLIFEHTYLNFESAVRILHESLELDSYWAKIEDKI
jgi:hypothetical protein